ncbi:MAG TPA: glycosyl hydrolase family 57 [Candidatus Methylomirabilis sp.]|nr:glycosyl hydrolase family 57 [Candidatus Methylomirabilis sp.]
MGTLPEYIDGLPNICGAEEQVAAATKGAGPAFAPQGGIDFGRIKSAVAIALHMHQPLIPAGGPDLRTAAVISNLKYMLDNPHIGDNHNASVFHWCYKRMGEFIPALFHEGKQPRVMLDYSGCLLHGLRQMGLHDVFDTLQRVTCDPTYRHCVEWLGTAWGHAVAPSTPVQDFRLHVMAWQHHFAGIFGLEALGRVKGFSPPEMALPNHPEVAYEYVKTLKECGYQWVLVQEHSVERVEDGGPMRFGHIPHRLVVRNTRGESQSIIAIIKTQGSDTKLVAQMQPYYEAKGLGRANLAGKQAPPLVTQIGDGENGGVMMNEFPPKYFDVMREASGSETPPVNVGEYLEYLRMLGIGEADLPRIQPIHQKRLWDRFGSGGGPDRLAQVIEELKREDHRFNMEGGSWTNNISWVKGYENVLGPMESVSALFAEKALGKVPTSEHRYRNALFYLLTTQTSCYRYWGQGIWTEYARELCRRTSDILTHDF